MNTMQTDVGAQSLFDQAIDTKYLGTASNDASIYTGNLLTEFCIGSVPNGGKCYVASTILHAVMQHYSQRHQKDPIAMNLFFMAKTRPGPCVIEITDMKQSKKGYCLSQAIFRQTKDSKAPELTSAKDYDPEDYTHNITSILTFGNFAAEEGVTHIYKPAEPPAREELQPMAWRFMNHVLQGSADQRSFVKNKGDIGKPELRHVVGFKDKRPIDFVSIPYWCDMIVPPAMLLGPTALGGEVWVPTMQMEVLFKGVPKGKEIFCNFISRYIVNGRDEMDGEIWDEDGTLLALTRHQCLVVPWTRNTKPKL
ncbi:hypothetical protein INT43_002422 [Umbelopsis isabellina]|uniref:Uncharacterized protein n=1 Tax=Mortierella isabellina TaxID=91625 RepID=A0A8H7Q3U3_MORIS|nr:hypothetical protein INT43_002422 [Umbelopsis isabellina]